MSSPASEVGSQCRTRRHLASALRTSALSLALLTSVASSIAVAPGWVGLAGASLALLVCMIAIIDYRTYRIPNWLNVLGFILALFHAGLRMPDELLTGVALASLRGAVLALCFFCLWTIYRWIRGREGLGLGDVKLAAVAGAWLDWLFIPVAVQLAAFAALSAFLVQHLLAGRSLSLTSRLPFGAFFAPAIWVSWLLEQVLQHL